MTVAAIQQHFQESLESIYPPSEARNITRWILEETLNVSSLQINFNRFLVLTSHQRETLENALQLLLQHQPLQYVLGNAYFLNLKLKVTPDVLIPRPETEELVNWVLESKNDNLRVLDIGTGSGCIAIAIKKQRVNWEVQALDCSEAAIGVAQENAANHQTIIGFSRIDILKEIPNQKFDVIVSNPPYIGWEEKKDMRENVLNHEPHLALFSEDPLQFYKRIAAIGKAMLSTNGKIFLELNEHYAAQIKTIFENNGFTCNLRSDLQGKPRMLLAAITGNENSIHSFLH